MLKWLIRYKKNPPRFDANLLLQYDLQDNLSRASISKNDMVSEFPGGLLEK